MKKYAIINIVGSILIGFYSFYINIQANETLMQTQQLKEFQIEKENSREDFNYAIENIIGANEAITINIKIIFFFILIVIGASALFLMKASKK